MDLVGTSPRSQPERTRREDRRLKFYGLRDMLLKQPGAGEPLLSLDPIDRPVVEFDEGKLKL